MKRVSHLLNFDQLAAHEKLIRSQLDNGDGQVVMINHSQ